MERLFLQHPRSLGETYLGHQLSALQIAWSLLCAAVACFVHALVPAMFETTASGIIRRLHQGLGHRQARSTGAKAADLLEYQI